MLLIHAYLDPGTGSYFLQMLIAALIGALYTLKLYWSKVKSFFKNLFISKENKSA